ncbi:major facilitator superfamily domain-containing protein [Phycomyces nitens]|nr:major facilitator superfamily domain-containing protein [Phycomyces nitens]
MKKKPKSLNNFLSVLIIMTEIENEIANERSLVRKLDKRLLVFAMFGNLVKTLDNTNLGSAFISGMEEELNITGIQYNWMSVLFMIGYLVMQIPSNIMLSKLRPSVYLSCLEVIWCVLTVAMACAQNVKTVYVIRLLLGLSEAGFYPGIVFLIGSWYTKRELGKRLAILTIFGSLGSGLSGVIQAIMLKTLDGVFGISGWRWMFLFDAFITALLALFGYIGLPDYPYNTQWLSRSESQLATRRLEDTQKPTAPRITKSFIKHVLGNKYLGLFVLGWASVHIALGAPHVLGIVAKKLGYDAVTSNLLTTPNTLITMAFTLANGFISDHLRTRVWCIIVPCVFGFIGCCMLSGFVQPFGLLYLGFIFTDSGLKSTTSIVMTWASEIISPHTEIRAMSIAVMNTSASLMWTWTPLILWPVTDAPYYHTGFTVSVFCILIFIGSMGTIGYISHQSNDGEKTIIPDDISFEPLLGRGNC